MDCALQQIERAIRALTPSKEFIMVLDGWVGEAGQSACRLSVIPARTEKKLEKLADLHKCWADYT